MSKINNVLKKLFIIILIIVFTIAFNNSYKKLSIDNVAFLIALGIDKSDNNEYTLTFQFTKSISSGESGSSETSPSIIYIMNASSIGNGINLLDSYIGKEINLSHCKLVVISEELAKKGISKEIYTLTNDIELRPSSNIVISKCSAKTYIQNSQPVFENLLPQYYETFPNSSEFTGLTGNATIGDFFNSLVCSSCEPSAILGGLNSEFAYSPTQINSQKNSNVKANASPIENSSNSDNAGLAVFKDDVLVGELNSLETLCYLTIENEVDRFLVSIPNPENSESYIDIYLFPKNKTKIDLKITNGSPYIKLDLDFDGQIYSIDKNTNYLDSTLLDNISTYCSSYLESNISNYLYKTSKNFKSDINGFGFYCRSKFLTLSEFSNYNWKYKYKDSTFDVKVDCEIKSSYLLNQT